MDVVWIFVAVGAVFVGWILLKVTLGAFVSPHVSGRAMFKQLVKKAGLDPSIFSEACVAEIIEICVDLAGLKERMTREGFSTEFVQSVEYAANEAILIIRNGTAASENWVHTIMRKHNIIK